MNKNQIKIDAAVIDKRYADFQNYFGNPDSGEHPKQ
jgi:hypothetical protein